MPRPIKIGKKWKTNLDMPCNGAECPWPGKPLPHKHRRRFTFATREACELKIGELQRVRTELKQGGTPRGEISWPGFKIKYTLHITGKADGTQKWDNLAIKYLEKFFPIQKLKQITPELLGAMRIRLTEGGMEPHSVNRIVKALKAMMHLAEDWKFIDPQAWRTVKRIQTPKGRLHFWKEGEIKALYGVCRGVWATVAMLAVEAGLRREEIRSLKVENVDFDRNRIHIVGDDEWHPKTFERRFIPMKSALRKHLKTVCRCEYVLGDSRPTKGSMTTYFRRLVKDAHLAGSLHTGRHTYAAHLAMQGIPMAIIQNRMGHESIKTTEIYTHLCPDKTQELYAA